MNDIWQDDPEFPVQDWQSEVAAGDTRLGYREWLTGKRANTQHAHEFQGQKLVHSHPGGDAEHGYYEHPEDPR